MKRLSVSIPPLFVRVCLRTVEKRRWSGVGSYIFRFSIRFLWTVDWCTNEIHYVRFSDY